MPYYVYQVTPLERAPGKSLEQLASFEAFRAARDFAREQRSIHDADPESFKVIFANNPLEAEDRLLEKREAPILKEWEK